MTVTIFRWMEIYPEKNWTVHRIMRVAYDVKCTVHFFGACLHPPKNYYHLIFSAIKTPKSQFDVNVANGVAIDIADDLLQVWWMEVCPFRFNQSKSLLHAEIK